MLCAALTLGYHIATAHDASLQARSQMNELNPGVYAQCDTIVVGAYFNTVRHTSVYAGKSIQLARGLDLVIGGVTGYKVAPVVPMAMVSYRLADGTRLSLIPTTPKNVGGLHISREF